MSDRQQHKVAFLSFGASVVAHVCIVALFAGIDWSVTSTRISEAADGGTALAEESRGFPAAEPAGGTGGATAGMSTELRIVEAGVQRVEWSIPSLLTHVWESTLVAAVVGLLVVLLRKSAARVRYALWLGASIKFLLPFSALVGLGGLIGRLLPLQPDVATALRVSTTEVARWAPGIGVAIPPVVSLEQAPINMVVLGLAIVWLCGAAGIAAMRYVLWRRVRAAFRVSTPLTLPGIEVPIGVQLRRGPSNIELGVIGWRRPVLLVPVGIESRLTIQELRAVIAHEMCHVRRRDNLTSALHMLTEVAFWFHPVVWWIGARMVAERERACDETVVATGHEPATYARAIVHTCALYTTSPIPFVLAVTASDLSTRLEAILKNERSSPVRTWKRAVLVATATGVLGGPLALGLSHATTSAADLAPQGIARSQSAEATAFEVASIKVNNSGQAQAFQRVEPGGRFIASNMALAVLVRFAYAPPRSRGLEPFEVKDGPAWIQSERFDINATAGRDVSLPEVRAMLRTLLAERFQLRTHIETTQGPVYRLSVARPGRLGPQLRPAKADCAAVPLDPLRGFTPGEKPTCGYFGPSPDAPIDSTRAYQAIRGMQMQEFARAIYPHLRRQVIDETGLTGYFDGEFEFTADVMLPPPPDGVNPFDGRTLPSIFSVLPQQLGLKLESGPGQVEVLVIDQAERPTPD